MASVATLFFTPTNQAFAQEAIDAAKENKVKAVFLYSFGRYVTWPDSSFDQSEDKFLIGVVGKSPIVPVLNRIAETRNISGRTIEIVSDTDSETYSKCQILFFSGSVAVEEQANVLQAVEGKSVLIVGETPGFANELGCINFFIGNNTVRFEINNKATSDRLLNLNAKLLSLGKPIQAN